MCACGAAVENMQHVHLDCELFLELRRPLLKAMDSWLERARETEHGSGFWGRADRAAALHWVHYNEPLVMDTGTACQGDKVRQAALESHSQVHQMRYMKEHGHTSQTEPPSVAEGAVAL